METPGPEGRRLPAEVCDAPCAGALHPDLGWRLVAAEPPAMSATGASAHLPQPRTLSQGVIIWVGGVWGGGGSGPPRSFEQHWSRLRGGSNIC